MICIIYDIQYNVLKYTPDWVHLSNLKLSTVFNGKHREKEPILTNYFKEIIIYISQFYHLNPNIYQVINILK